MRTIVIRRKVGGPKESNPNIKQMKPLYTPVASKACTVSLLINISAVLREKVALLLRKFLRSASAFATILDPSTHNVYVDACPAAPTHGKQRPKDDNSTIRCRLFRGLISILLALCRFKISHVKKNLPRPRLLECIPSIMDCMYDPLSQIISKIEVQIT